MRPATGRLARRAQPRLLAWWQDNPADPDRPTLANPDVQQMIAAISPGAQATDLGGVMSLNVRLEPAEQGLLAAVPLLWRGVTVYRRGRHRHATSRRGARPLVLPGRALPRRQRGPHQPLAPPLRPGSLPLPRPGGLERWVGLLLLAHNLHAFSRRLADRAASPGPNVPPPQCPGPSPRPARVSHQKLREPETPPRRHSRRSDREY